MTPVSLSQIAGATDGTLIGADCSVTGHSTDTRTVAAGDVYFCLRGDNFDGHNFARDAIDKGAVAVVCEKDLQLDVPQLIVSDTRRAFGRFAMLWREQFSKPVIGVTGSNGKTTVKQLLGSIFNQAGKVHCTRANDNNEIGVPQTLLGLAADQDFAVVEMGASDKGEIEYLGELVMPTVSVITNAGAAHLEGFGDAQSVAREKAWIYKSLATDGVAVVNADDSFFKYWSEVCADKKMITFGVAGDVTARREANGSISVSYAENTVNCEYKLAGQHNVQNAAAASACAIAAGVSMNVIAKGLASAEPVAGRLNFISLSSSGITIIDDTYNANPASTRAAINVLGEFDGARFLALGDLLELGADEIEQHRAIGLYARQNKVNRLLAFGELSKHAATEFGVGADWFTTKDALLKVLSSELGANSTVLVKGSRSMKMEQIVVALKDQFDSVLASGSKAGPEASSETGVCC